MRPNPSLLWLMSRTPASYIGAMVLLFGVVFLAAGLLILDVERVFAPAERRAQAELLGKASRKVADESGGRRAYDATYRFETAAGETITATSEIGYGRWRTLNAGDAIEIDYLISAPERSRLAPQQSDDTALGWAFALCGAFGVAAGAGLCGWMARSARRLQRLARDGDLLAAETREIRRIAVRVNNRPQFRLIYEYEDWRGDRHQGASRMGSWARFEAIQIGQGAAVYVDREDPENSAWSGDLI